MKAANSYASLLGGVSQQVPQDRSDGQHTEQVNLLSDPVNGLSRRHGSKWLGEVLRPGMGAANMLAYTNDADKFRTLDFDSFGKEYSLIYAVKPRTRVEMGYAHVYNKTDKVWLTTSVTAGDAGMNAISNNGIAGITQVGKYILMTANNTSITGATVNQWNPNAGNTVIWVRGGAYSRKFTVSFVRTDGTVGSVEYTTPSSSFQGVLNTSDIIFSDPEYSKKVNDRVNAYNSLVTAWIGQASAMIAPDAIAESLRLQLAAAGVAAGRIGSNVVMDGIRAISVNDGGNGELVKSVANDITSIDDVTSLHLVGKVIRVRPKQSKEAFYLKAVAKTTGLVGWQEVTWQETAGVESDITGGFFYGVVDDGVFKMASSANLLELNAVTNVPRFDISTAGDLDSAPAPYFVGRQVSYLGTFQNRLLVGSGGVLALSKTDEYLNFFRSTVLTVPADDPFEMLPQGSEDDTLLSSVPYDRDLVLFGTKRQYSISGQVTLTPLSASMPVLANYENASECPPISAGGFIFYAKAGGQFSSMFQIQPGQTENSPESFPASSQIDSYLRGNPVEMAVATGSPSTLFLRTTGYKNGLYTFSYLDKADGRKMDAWARWEFNEKLGPVMGMSVDTGGITVYTLRLSRVGGIYFVADFCSTSSGLSSTPYLDSQQTPAAIASKIGSIDLFETDAFSVAFPAPSVRRFAGTSLPRLADLYLRYPVLPTDLIVGANYDSFVTLTNPYMRDGKDKAILSGRLTVTRFILALRQSVGCRWVTMYRGVEAEAREFNGRILGDPSNQIGVEPVGDAEIALPIGRETRQFDIRIGARKWYPFTLTAVEWVGQFFNRVQRF